MYVSNSSAASHNYSLLRRNPVTGLANVTKMLKGKKSKFDYGMNTALIFFHTWNHGTLRLCYLLQTWVSLDSQIFCKCNSLENLLACVTKGFQSILCHQNLPSAPYLFHVFFFFSFFFELFMVKYALQGPECLTGNLNKEASRAQYLGME